MAKTRRPNHTRPNTSKGPGEGGDCAAAEEAEVEGRGGKQGDEAVDPPHRRRELTQERHEATESGDETKAEEGQKEEMYRGRDTPRGARVEVVRMGGDVPPLQENSDHPDFTPECAHLLLQGVYGDFLHHNSGSHLDRRVADAAVWKLRWHQLAA